MILGPGPGYNWGVAPGPREHNTGERIMIYWLATDKSTKETTGPRFKTKRDAIAYGRKFLSGIFIVWKVDTIKKTGLNGR